MDETLLRRAVTYVTPHLLSDALHLPEGTEILGADWDFIWNRLRLLVRHPDLPISPEGVPALQKDALITETCRLAGPTDLIRSYKSKWV